MAEMESLMTQVWNSGTRSLAEEALRCYNAGAMRASIAATWTAVTADLIAKIEYLADDGDPQAEVFRNSVGQAQLKGLTPDGVRAMQQLEAKLLSTAVDLELIDAIDQRGLERIREDRNLSVHPSLRPFNDAYSPPSEVARAHLAIALNALLIHRPTQGRKIIDSYLNFTCAQSFGPAIGHIQSAYFDRVRAASRRGILGIAAKHAVLELDPDGRFDAKQYADRSAVVLSALALRDRDAVREAVVALRDRFRHVSPNRQRRALGRLGHEDFFWAMTDESLVERINSLIAEPIPADSPIGDVECRVLSMVAVEPARTRLSNLTKQFDTLPSWHQVAVISVRPAKYFVPQAVKLIKSAGTYRSGDRIGEVLLKLSQMLEMQDLADALAAWAENDQCRKASSMPEVAVKLYWATSHLGEERNQLFRTFLECVQSYAEKGDDYYKYPELESAIASTGK